MSHVEKQNQLKLDQLRLALIDSSTTATCISIVQQIQLLIGSKTSKYCLITPRAVARLKRMLNVEKLLDEELTGLLDAVSQQGRAKIDGLQEKHRKLSTKCDGLELAKINLLKQKDDSKRKIAMTKNNVATTKSMVSEATHELAAARQAHATAQEQMVNAKRESIQREGLGVDQFVKDLCLRESYHEMKTIEKELRRIDAMEDAKDNSLSSSSSSSSSLVVVGAKRDNSSSSSSTTRESKRSKKENVKEVMTMHPGQWLYEKGRTYWFGMDYKKKDTVRGRKLVETSALSGFPMAVAHCHRQGWNSYERNQKKAFEMFQKIEKETNGYHWVQYMLSDCYQTGHGVSKDKKKVIEYYSLSSEQGNSVAMRSLGDLYNVGAATNENKTKAFELYEKSANLGHGMAMKNIGDCYKNGSGVTKDLNKAKEWLIKAIEHGVRAQSSLGAVREELRQKD